MQLVLGMRTDSRSTRRKHARSQRRELGWWHLGGVGGGGVGRGRPEVCHGLNKGIGTGLPGQAAD